MFCWGIQSNGISACVKHYAANSQELRRMTNDFVVDERTLREIYLRAFKMAVKEGGEKSLMTSYNRVNGIYTHEHPHLLRDAHPAVAATVAEKCAVLLKNEDDILPLKKEQRIAVSGDFTREPRYQGTGSSKNNLTKGD